MSPRLPVHVALGTGHYLAGGGERGGLLCLGGGLNFFSLTLGGLFFKMPLRGGLRILAHKYSVSIYLKSSNSQFSLFQPTVSVLCNYACKHGALFYKKSL